MIAILDYDAGNLKSVEKALSFLGEKSVITRDRREDRDSAYRVEFTGIKEPWKAVSGNKRQPLCIFCAFLLFKGKG